MHLARRDLLLGLPLLLAGVSAYAGQEDPLDRLEQRLGGRLGLSALNTATGARLRHRADDRFAMCSTFKATLVAAVLVLVDRGELKLDRPIKFTAGDLVGHAPVTRAHVREGALPIETLCAAAIEVSDNTAANLLLSLIGGPQRLTEFFRAIGDPVSRLDRTEPELNTNQRGDPRDTTTPDAMLDTLRTLLVEPKILSAASRTRMTGWMQSEQNGRARIRAGLPPTWRVANKPGTSGNGATNDIAVAWPPDRAPIVIAIYTDASGVAPEAGAAIIADAARIVASRLT
jgi:beta-lactamase class A